MTEILVNAGPFLLRVDLSHVQAGEDARQGFRTGGDEVGFVGKGRSLELFFALWLRAITDVPSGSSRN